MGSLREIKSFGGKKAFALAGVVFGLFMCLTAHSQTLGRISGIVTDTSGGAISGAMVTVTDVGRGIPRTLTTDSTGAYSAPNLIPGTYSVHAAYMGFKAFDRQDIDVEVGGDVHVDVTLQPGEQSQTVTVTGEAPAISTTNAQLEGTVTSQALSDLPIAGHNYIQLLGLLPTLEVRPGSGAGPIWYSNGLRGEYDVYVLDGVASQESYYISGINTGYPAGGPEQAVMLPTDAIQEFDVVTNSKAEFGWRPGAQLNVAVKSGTNSLHGEGFASGRDTGLTDRNAFASFKPPVAFEDFDATLGGAIKKDKLFYLISYEGQRYNIGNPRNASVPTTVADPGGVASPSTSLPDAAAAALAAGKLNSVMMSLAGCVSAPVISCTPGKGLFSSTTNAAGPSGSQFLVDFPTFGGTNNGVGRVDYHLNDRNIFSGEYFNGDGIAVAPVSSVNEPYWSTPMEIHTQILRGWWTWAPNSTWVNDARFGWDHVLFANSPAYDCPSNPSGDTEWVSGAGAPNYAALGFVGGGTPSCALPSITITGFTGTVLGGATGSLVTSGMERVLDSVSWTHGNHITKFGGEFVESRGTLSLSTDRNKGTLTFSSLQNFMEGVVSTYSLQVGTVPRQLTYPEFAGYIQDDWRLLPRLTVNLGLRYEYTATIHEVNDLLGNVDVGSPTGMTQAGQNGSLYKLSPWSFGPRIGLAYDITGKGTTVLRAGFNIIYQNPSTQPFLNAGMGAIPTGLPLINGANTINEGGSINLFYLQNITPPAASATIVANQPFFGTNVAVGTGSCTTAVPCSLGGVTSYLVMPEVLNWNFGVQHAITNNLTIDAEYAATHGQHLFDLADINQPTPGTSGSAAENSRRPLGAEYPWLSQIKLLGAVGNISNYNALQVTVRERVTHGLTFLATYTYSHALDDNSSDLSPTLPENSLNPGAEYGNASFDVRHRVTFGPSYILPSKPGYAQMLQGWQVATTASVFSGRPINPTDPVAGGDDISGTGEGQDRWSLFGNPNDFSGFGMASPIPCYDNSATASATWKSACTAGLPQACINAASAEPNSPVGTGVVAPNNTGLASLNRLGCYMMGSSVIVPPAQGTFGSMSRYEIYGIGYWDWDMSIIKTFKIKENITTQFRADIYNVTNTTQFFPPASTLSSPSTFGEASATPDIGANSPIVGTGGPRKIQLGLKIIF